MGLVVIVALVVANMILIPLAIRHAQGSGDRKPVKRRRPHHAPGASRAGSPATSPTPERDPLLMSSGGRIILSSTRGIAQTDPDPPCGCRRTGAKPSAPSS